jgi:hypothetical protein
MFVYFMASWSIYGHLVYFMVIWYILPFWYVVPREIWQPWYTLTFLGAKTCGRPLQSYDCCINNFNTGVVSRLERFYKADGNIFLFQSTLAYLKCKFYYAGVVTHDRRIGFWCNWYFTTSYVCAYTHTYTQRNETCSTPLLLLLH